MMKKIIFLAAVLVVSSISCTTNSRLKTIAVLQGISNGNTYNKTISQSGWYVMTYGGQRVAGPFNLIQDCQELAKIMQLKYSNISSVCQ